MEHTTSQGSTDTVPTSTVLSLVETQMLSVGSEQDWLVNEIAESTPRKIADALPDTSAGGSITMMLMLC
jgi:hypothetical protein